MVLSKESKELLKRLLSSEFHTCTEVWHHSHAEQIIKTSSELGFDELSEDFKRDL